MLLEVVTANRIGKHLIAEAISGWHRQQFMQQMTSEQRQQIVMDFRARILRCVHTRQTKKRLRQAQDMWSETEQTALLNLPLAWRSHGDESVAASPFGSPDSASATALEGSQGVSALAAAAGDAPFSLTTTPAVLAQSVQFPCFTC